MAEKEVYDAIIVGAGPAGLSLASVLSQKNKICVIEKNKIGSTTKSWASFRDRIRKMGLSRCIVNNKITSLKLGHFLGGSLEIKDNYCHLDELKLLNEFKKRCNKKNTTFFENKCFSGFRRNKQGISLSFGKRKLETKLLVDCCGFDSPIIKKYRLIDNYSALPILGANIKNIKVNDKEYAWNFINTGKHNSLIWGGIMPYSDNSAQIHVGDWTENRRRNPNTLKKYLKQFLNAPEFKNAKIIKKTQGMIIGGELKKNALDNVFFFGASGLWAPAVVGTGMNQILLSYQSVGKELDKLLKEDRLSEEVLSKIKPTVQDNHIFHFLRCLEKITFSMKNNPEKLNELFLILKQSHSKLGQCMMRNKYNFNVLAKTWKNIHKHFSVIELVEILPKKDILYLLEFGAELIEDSILDKYRKQLEDI